MKTRLHLKALVLTLGLTCLPAAHAGIPTVDATNVIYSPLTYFQVAEQTINTIQQIENQIIMYMNQIKQIEQAAQNLKGSLDFNDIESIEDLKSRITTLKSAYQGQIDAYNNWAKATNTYLDFACDWSKNYVKCKEEQDKLDEALKAQIKNLKKAQEEAFKELNKQAQKDAEQITEFASEVFDDYDNEKDGLNQSVLNGIQINTEIGKQTIANQNVANIKLDNIEKNTEVLVKFEEKREKEQRRTRDYRRLPPNFKVQTYKDKL